MLEDWFFIFYEGLNRYFEFIFKDKIVVEFGCGNGWIIIVIVEKWLFLKVCYVFVCILYGSGKGYDFLLCC